MAVADDLRTALEASRLRLTAVEEQLVCISLLNIDTRINAFLTKSKDDTEAREPYEFS